MLATQTKSQNGNPPFVLNKYTQALELVHKPLKNFTIVHLSDVHLFHPRVPTEHILTNLETCLLKDPTFKDVDFFIIAGDLFDSLIPFNTDDVDFIWVWFEKFLTFCQKNKIMVRVLEGTPSHDRLQAKRLLTINSRLETPADLKFIDTVSVLYEPSVDKHFLYVPDEVHPKSEVVWGLVQKALEMAGLTKVDFAIMHGMMDYQCPVHMRMATYNSELYKSIVKYFIAIGHIHTPSNHDDIIFGAGSFDRLKMGEEEPKGLMKYAITGDSFTAEFVENKNAMMHTTVELSEIENDTEAIKYVLEHFEKCKKGFLRLGISQEQLNRKLYDTIAGLLPNLEVARIIRGKELPVLNDPSKVHALKTALGIHPNNVLTLLKERQMSKRAQAYFEEKIWSSVN